MLITKVKPAGLDVNIQKLQSLLYNELIAKWGIAEADYECYGRCYRNRKESGYVAEVYTGKNEYKEVYWNDQLTAISFFGLNNTEIAYEAGINKLEVHLVFFVNLQKLKPTIAHRADEEVRKDVQNVIGAGMYGFTYESMVLWLENVLKEYSGTLKGRSGLSNEALKAVDMHPVHCFRINLKTLFDINNC